MLIKITQADPLAVFGLAMMVYSKWKHFGEVGGDKWWSHIPWVLLCLASDLSKIQNYLSHSIFLFIDKASTDELRACVTESHSWTEQRLAKQISKTNPLSCLILKITKN